MKKFICLTLICMMFTMFSVKKHVCYFDLLPQEIIQLIFQEVMQETKSIQEYYQTKSRLKLTSKKFRKFVVDHILKHSEFSNIDDLVTKIDKEKINDIIPPINEDPNISLDLLLSLAKSGIDIHSCRRFIRKLVYLGKVTGKLKKTSPAYPLFGASISSFGPHKLLTGKNLLKLLLSGQKGIHIQEEKKHKIILGSDCFCWMVYSSRTVPLSDWLEKQKKQEQIKKETLEALQKLLSMFPHRI